MLEKPFSLRRRAFLYKSYRAVYERNSFSPLSKKRKFSSFDGRNVHPKNPSFRLRTGNRQESSIQYLWRPSLFHPPNAGTAKTPVYVSLSFSVSARDADESSAAALSPDARISGQFCFAFPAVSCLFPRCISVHSVKKAAPIAGISIWPLFF